MRDTLADRWSDQELRHAFNEALSEMLGRVSISHPLLLAGNGHGYILPEFATNRGRVQIKDQDGIWRDVFGYTIEHEEDGRRLYLERDPGGLQVRYVFYAPLGNLPVQNVTLAAPLSTFATTASVNAVEEMPDFGFAMIGNEWLRWVGVERNGSLKVLRSLGRGLHATAAQNHNTSAVLEFGVVLPDLKLEEAIFYRIALALHRYYLNDGSVQEKNFHQNMVTYYENKLERFWRNWTTPNHSSVRIGLDEWAR